MYGGASIFKIVLGSMRFTGSFSFRQVRKFRIHEVISGGRLKLYWLIWYANRTFICEIYWVQLFFIHSILRLSFLFIFRLFYIKLYAQYLIHKFLFLFGWFIKCHSYKFHASKFNYIILIILSLFFIINK
jgi:hypothetical protein